MSEELQNVATEEVVADENTAPAAIFGNIYTVNVRK